VLCFSAFSQVYKESGVASYYSNVFNGRRTASGEKFYNNEYTAAHKFLPFNTILKVTNLDNNKSVEVRVNDRGPNKKGRVIDISYRAAEEIDLIPKGCTMVTVEIIQLGTNDEYPDSCSKRLRVDSLSYDSIQLRNIFSPKIKSVPDSGFGVQIATYESIRHIKNILKMFEKYDLIGPVIRIMQINNTKIYQLIFGPF